MEKHLTSARPSSSSIGLSRSARFTTCAGPGISLLTALLGGGRAGALLEAPSKSDIEKINLTIDPIFSILMKMVKLEASEIDNDIDQY